MTAVDEAAPPSAPTSGRSRSTVRGFRVAGFLTVGASGVVVNTAVLLALSGGALRLPYLLASALATQVAIMWNFLLTDRLVFRGAREGSPWPRFVRFWALNVGLLPVQLILLAAFVEGLRLHPGLANLVVLGFVFALRYVMTEIWIYRQGGAGSPAAPLAGEEENVLATMADPGVGRPRPLAGPALRLVLLVLLTLAAFPNAVASAVTAPSTASVGPIVCLLAAVTLAIGRGGPRADEPDVHDRPLDLILAAPLFAVTAWLTVFWPAQLGLSTPLTDREAVAMVTFATGASLLMMGTRMTFRLRWPLLVALTAAPALAGHVLVVAAVVVAVALAQLRLFLGRRSAQLERRSEHAPPFRWTAPALVLAASALNLAVLAH